MLSAVQGRALSKVPVELWREIFAFVTSVPRKYEFTRDGAAYVMANEASRTETGIPNHEEVAKAIKLRLRIIQVCKHWYSIGIQALWSHLRINSTSAEAIGALLGIRSAIDHDPTLASFVLRLTIVRPRTSMILADPGVFNRHLNELTGRLPSLHTYICPWEYALGMAKPLLDIVVWEQAMHPEVYNKYSEQLAYIQNMRVLSISFQHSDQVVQDWNSLHFPRLESLRLRTDTISVTDVLTRSWNIPNLQILSIRSSRPAPWLEFIEKWGGILRTLELSFRTRTINWSRIIQLPALRELLVDGRLCRLYKIVAPKLERFCIFRINSSGRTVRVDVIAIVDHARKSFPTLKRLRLRGLEGQPYEGDPFIVPVDGPIHNLTSHHLDGWREARLEMDVRSS
jgi:hypothetical protein